MIRAALATLAFVSPGLAETLDLPANAVRALEDIEPLGSHTIATGPWAGSGLPYDTVEGRVSREAWNLSGGSTTLQLVAPLRSQLTGLGYEILFECETDGCGGFDFRFQLDILPEPEMHVDLGDFRYLSAQRGENDFVSVLASRTSERGYIELVRVGPAVEPETPPAQLASKSPDPETGADVEAASDLAQALEQIGRAVLADLSFETGSSRLADATFTSLDALAGYLRDNPDRTITLVGHTDASGSLDANIALSRARARAVLDRLVTAYGIPPRQLEADGVGYLMPLASNLTEDGRGANRRVEVVLTSTD